MTDKDCQICYDSKPEKDFFSLECGHKFCLDCTKQQLKILIINSKILKISCFEPQCGTTFTDNQIKNVLSGDHELD